MFHPIRMPHCLCLVVVGLFFTNGTSGQSLLIEAESFVERGGWKLDTQFINEMGSPYLLAHGLGRPVKDAETTATFPEIGEYRVYVRTKDWVARWKAPGHPGKFQLLVDGHPLPETFGNKGAEWHWQDGGVVNIQQPKLTLALRDLTGFDGRCDAILFTKENSAPPNQSDVLSAWRKRRLNLPAQPIEQSGYDLVVVGGGYSGIGAALSAARSGCKVALIQNRPVLGGNGSSEVRVWSQGLIRRGIYPRIGEIVEEFCDHATKSPGGYEEFEDAKKEKIVRREPNIDLFLNHHAYEVETEDQTIVAIRAFDTRTSEHKRFSGKLFVDCTGHGTIGFLAGADWDMTATGRMGMSNMWAWDEGEHSNSFPETPWALDLNMTDFPYPRDHHGQWFWESGFDKDPLQDAEGIRDWNLRAVFGAFNAMKNRGGAAKHETAFLTWVAFVGGPRESRRLMGDVVLTQDDIVAKRDFTDGCVPSTWSIDLHYPKKQYAEKFPDNPFISIAVHDHRVDRSFGYPVPYRCLYSRNIDNLFMAGRCISVTHQALGTTRVMKTCGMMGEVVGRAASICVRNECLPRDVYQRYWGQMDQLLQLPGKARRNSVNETFTIPADAMELATSGGFIPGSIKTSLPGQVIDNQQAEMTGNWTAGTGLKGYVGPEYLYAAKDSGASIRYTTTMGKAGKAALGVVFLPHENRGTRVPVTVTINGKAQSFRINMKRTAQGHDGKPAKNNIHHIGVFDFKEGDQVSIEISTQDAGGIVHADAVQILPAENLNSSR